MPNLDDFRNQAAPGITTSEGPSVQEQLNNLKDRVDDIEAGLDELRGDYDQHTHYVDGHTTDQADR